MVPTAANLGKKMSTKKASKIIIKSYDISPTMRGILLTHCGKDLSEEK